MLLHRNLPCDARRFLLAIQPDREDLVVAVECIYSWSWLADLCVGEGIAFVLGHALYMRAIHGAKAKNDRIDSHRTAAMLRGGLIPRAYVYPRRDEGHPRSHAQAVALRASAIHDVRRFPSA